MTLPTFLHVGPQRCGTTYLYDSLKPLDCVPAKVKEIQFFDKHFDLGMEWYAAHFQQFQTAMTFGEICPSYFDCFEAVDRIKENLPSVKIVCTLRSPASRIPSYFRLLRMYGQCAADIETAWETNDELKECCMYSERLSMWMNCFGSRCLVLFFDDLLKHPQEYFGRFCDFVGVPLPADGIVLKRTPETEPIPRFPVLSNVTARIGTFFRRHQMYQSLEIVRAGVRPLLFRLGTAQYEIPMSAAFRDRIRDYYRHDIIRLSDITNRDLSSWL